METINLFSLLDQFSDEQQKDLEFFEKVIEKGVISTKVIEYIQRRLYIRRKFLAQLKTFGPFSIAPEEREILLQKIQKILDTENYLREALEKLLNILKERQNLLIKGRQALKAYRWSSTRKR